MIGWPGAAGRGAGGRRWRSTWSPPGRGWRRAVDRATPCDAGWGRGPGPSGDAADDAAAAVAAVVAVVFAVVVDVVVVVVVVAGDGGAAAAGGVGDAGAGSSAMR